MSSLTGDGRYSAAYSTFEGDGEEKKNLTECKSNVLNQRDVNNDEQAVILLPSAYITA